MLGMIGIGIRGVFALSDCEWMIADRQLGTMVPDSRSGS